MTLLRILTIAAILTVALGAAAARAEIVIATVGPMTGAKAWMGEQYQWGVELAVAEINARGGLLGQDVRLVIGDDACDAAQAVAVANKLVNDGIVFVAGHYCSHASIPASKVYEKAGIVMISPSSTNPLLTDEGGANVFRVCGRDDQQGEVAGDYLADHWHNSHIAIVDDQSIYGQGLARETRKQLNKRGVTEALNLSYTPDQIDYSPLITRLQEADIDVVYVGGYSAEVGLILRQARNQGFEAQLVSGDAVVTEDFWLTTGAAGEGALMTFFPDARETPEAASTVAEFRAQGFEPEGYTLYAYAAIQVWAEAVAQAATLDPQAVIAALHAGTFATVLGPIAFDAKGDVSGASFVWYVWRDGRYVPKDRRHIDAAGYFRNQAMGGSAMFDRLQVRGRLLLSFIGVSSFALIAAAVAIYSFLETGKGLDSITQRWVPSALASQELSRQTERIVALAPALLAVTTAQQHDAISGDIAAEVGQFDELLLQVNVRGSDPAHVVSIERNAGFIEDNLATLDGLVADHLAAAAHIQDLLAGLAKTNSGAQRLLTPGIRALDGEVAQLRRILADPDLSAAERPARVAALAQSIAAAAPLRRTQNEFSTINDTLIRAAAAETESDLAIFAHPLERALASLESFTAEFDGGLKRRLRARAEELQNLTESADGILRTRGHELAVIAEIESLLARNAEVSLQLTATLDGLIAGTNQDIQIANAAAADSQQRSTWILVAVVILSLIVSILIVWLYVGRNLIARLGALNGSMMAIAGGNLEAHIPTGGGDEISRMASALSGFRDTAIEVRETNMRELLAARRRLNDAIESISEGFSLFDPSDRLVVWNNRFKELLFPGRKSEIEADTPFETLMREAAESGYIHAEEGHVDKWMSERIVRHRAPSKQHLHQRSDARWILVSEHKTDDGGTVAIHTDITDLKRTEEELQDAYAIIKDQRDRMEDELNFGRDMQMSMVPGSFPAFPERQEVSIFGFLEPAREMGGDFYDYFWGCPR